MAKEPGPISSDTGALAVQVGHALGDGPVPDVVVVPGGPGSVAASGDPAHREWLRAAHRSARWVTSVCTGSELLAAAGLLDGLPATTHWTRRDRLAAFGARPIEARVVRNGKVVTAAGVSAGIDMALQVVAWELGDLAAQAIQLGIEYDPAPPHRYAEIGPEARALVVAALA